MARFQKVFPAHSGGLAATHTTISVNHDSLSLFLLFKRRQKLLICSAFPSSRLKTSDPLRITSTISNARACKMARDEERTEIRKGKDKTLSIRYIHTNVNIYLSVEPILLTRQHSISRWARRRRAKVPCEREKGGECSYLLNLTLGGKTGHGQLLDTIHLLCPLFFLPVLTFLYRIVARHCCHGRCGWQEKEKWCIKYP